MKLATLLLAAITCVAQTSVVFSKSTTATLAYGGFTAAQSVRVEGRMHARTISSAYTFAWQLGNVQNALQVTWVGTSLNDRIGCLFANSPVISSSPSPTDFDFRWQRTKDKKICEVWAITEAGQPLFYSYEAPITPVAIPAGNIAIGSPNNEFALAFLRIFIDSPVAAASTPPSFNTTAGNWANWEFEGTTAQQLKLDNSGNLRDLTFNSAPTIVATPPPLPTVPFQITIEFVDPSGKTIKPPVVCTESPCQVQVQVDCSAVPKP